jgi:endogenous inhibitor of DNA gyrase (YacG/DUF329 family)
MGSDLYLKIECPECRRKIRHHAKDAAVKKYRICPGCGKNISLAESGGEEPATGRLDC